MGVAYNPNDELRAIVQRKQREIQSLVAAHADSNDPLQVMMRLDWREGRKDEIDSKSSTSPRHHVRSVPREIHLCARM